MKKKLEEKIITHLEKIKDQVIDGLFKIKNYLANESKESTEMLEIYLRYTQGEASEEEMKKANNQFQDILKTLGLGIFVILPFAPLTIPLVVKIGKKFGVDIIPASLKKDSSNKSK